MGTLMRRIVFCATAILCGSALSPRSAAAHAALLKSSPNASSTVASVTEVRLQFSEEVVPDLCHIALLEAGGRTVDLAVANDPHDVRSLVAPLPGLTPGSYRVVWHVVSADGHPVSGTFTFTLAGVAASASAAPPPPPPADSATAGIENGLPVGAAAFRGIGVGGLLALAGILFFATGHGGKRVEEYRSAERILAAVTLGAIIIHLILWDRYVMPGQTFGAATWESMLASPPGRAELVRVVLVAVAAALVFTGAMPRLILGVALLAILTTAAIGHPATTTPSIAIPLTAIHLGAVAIWFGGLLSLVILRHADSVALAAHARNVSRLALIAAIVVTLTGIAQSALLLTAWADIVSTTYGLLLLAKLAGLGALVGFGAYHRLRALPRIAAGLQRDMTVSLRYEILAMVAVIIIAAFLSYTPLPR